MSKPLQMFGVDIKEYTADELEAIERFYRTINDNLHRKQPHWIGRLHYQFIVDELQKVIRK